jgi:hypothetical protein
MFLMPVITGNSNATVAARAIAGQINISGLSEGLFPFIVVGHSTDPAISYGLVPGQRYTIRWVGFQNASQFATGFTCQGDLIDAPGSPIPSYTTMNPLYSAVTSYPYYPHQFIFDAESAGFGGRFTGFINQYPNASTSIITAEVAAGYLGLPVSVGNDTLPWLINGARTSVGHDIDTRVGNDLLQSTTSYYTVCTGVSDCPANVASFESGYIGTGNGQRLAVVAIIGPPTYPYTAVTTVLDFGLFLLDPQGAYTTGGNQTWCAMYLGSGIAGTGRPSAAVGPGLYALRLLQ